MKNLNLKMLSLCAGLLMVSCISFAQQKPSERSLSAEMRTIETIKAKRGTLVTRLQQNTPIENGEILIQRDSNRGTQPGSALQRRGAFKQLPGQSKAIVD